MEVTYRLVKGSELTYQEGDDNTKFLDKKATFASVNPTATDDITQGFTVDKSLWFNTVSGVWFEVSEVTQDGAVWNEVPAHIQVRQNTTAIQANAQSIANLAGGQGQIAQSGLDLDLTTTPQNLEFGIVVDSTNEELFTFDDPNDRITFISDIAYNFYSEVDIESSTNSTLDLIFEIKKVSDDSVISTSSVTLSIDNNSTTSLSLATLVSNVGVNECYITARASDTGFRILAINSILSAGSGAGSSGGSTVNYVDKSANYTAVANDYINLDSSAGSFTITLPASPTANDVVMLSTGSGVETNNVTVDGDVRAGNVEDDTLTLDTNGVEVKLKFNDTLWEVFV